MPDEFVIIQISDLHLIEKLQTDGVSFGKDRFLVRSHKYDYYTHLIYSLQSVLNGRPADVLVVTGDVSTDGGRGSLRTAHRVITQPEITEGRLIERSLTQGLATFSRRFLVLPGNHDRYKSWRALQLRSNRLEKVFQLPNKYPYSRGVKTERSLPDVIFSVFDSTRNPDLLSKLDRARLWQWSACGVLTAGDRQALRNFANARTVQSLEDGTNIHIDDRSVHIALLHHHPLISDDPRDRDSGMMQCDGSRDFVVGCLEAGVDLVLFGHRHKFFNREVLAPGGPTVRFVCCATTLEYGCPQPGYLLYRIQPDKIVIERYEWQHGTYDKAIGAEIGKGFQKITSPDPIPL